MNNKKRDFETDRIVPLFSPFLKKGVKTNLNIRLLWFGFD